MRFINCGKKKASSQRNVVNVVDNPCERSFELKYILMREEMNFS